MSRICPKCGREYFLPPAVSRKDGKTDICPDCGMREALDSWKNWQNKVAGKISEGVEAEDG